MNDDEGEKKDSGYQKNKFGLFTLYDALTKSDWRLKKNEDGNTSSCKVKAKTQSVETKCSPSFTEKFRARLNDGTLEFC